MKPTIKQLLKGLPGIDVTGKDTLPVSALVTDSRRVGPGSLFFAISGLRTDGHFFIEEAIDRGAVAVVCEKDVWVPPHVTHIRTDNLRPVVAKVAARFYGHPETGLALTGFLGTSGKTVCSTILRHFLNEDTQVGQLGTLNYAVGNRTLPAHRTTPEPIELFGLLAQMREQDCRRVLMEVSAHGIDQKRVEGLQFRNLVLLNLTPEHLHYHGSLENYVALERQFILQQADGLANLVVGIDDPEVRTLVETLPESLRSRTVTFGLDKDATFRAEAIRYTSKDTRFTLVWPDGRLDLVSPLLGEFNLQNTLAAIACGHAEGVQPAKMGADLIAFTGVRGRMERVDEGQDYTVLIDYMHTEAAYEKGLKVVRSFTKGRLLTVFGCGGNRDPKTRPVITRLVSELSDAAFATSDNPRNETIGSIFDDMQQGNESLSNVTFIDDRRAAIAAAFAEAQPGDTVLIAGKGHETFQEFGDCVVPFDDRAVAREVIRNKKWNGT